MSYASGFWWIAGPVWPGDVADGGAPVIHIDAELIAEGVRQIQVAHGATETKNPTVEGNWHSIPRSSSKKMELPSSTFFAGHDLNPRWIDPRPQGSPRGRGVGGWTSSLRSGTTVSPDAAPVADVGCAIRCGIVQRRRSPSGTGA